MKRGDHIFVKRLGYTHHGIDCGDGSVIHYTGELGQKANATIHQTSKDDFLKGAEEAVRDYGQCDSPNIVIERATSRLGEPRYHLVFNNCEHFATWCKTGKHQSEQVRRVASTAGGGAGAGSAVAVGIGVVSATGEVAGLSAAGVMSGLASVGGVVGGGVVAGIAMVGAVPTTFTTAAMLYVLRDDPILHGAEREARKAGRIATVAGAAAGSASAIGAVAASGSVAGLSAAGITSGLAAIGGGTMIAGVVVTAALPALVAVGAGYGSYRIWKALCARSSGKEPDPQPRLPAKPA